MGHIGHDNHSFQRAIGFNGRERGRKGAKGVMKKCRMQNAELRMQKRMKNDNDLKERTTRFALCIIKVYSSLPTSPVAQVLGKQVLRSGTSVGANYREATRGRSKAEFIAKMGDCLKELDETIYWLELLIESGTLSKERSSDLLLETQELTAIFVTIIKNTKRNMERK